MSSELKREIFAFLKKDAIRDTAFMFKQLYPLMASCNDDHQTNEREKSRKHPHEIPVPLVDIRQLAQGDDNVLSRQCHIENTIQRLLKIMASHDFNKQLALSNSHSHAHRKL